MARPITRDEIADHFESLGDSESAETLRFADQLQNREIGVEASIVSLHGHSRVPMARNLTAEAQSDRDRAAAQRARFKRGSK